MHGLPAIHKMNSSHRPREKEATTDFGKVLDCWLCSFCGADIKVKKQKYGFRRGLIRYLVWPIPCQCRGAEMARLITG